MTPPLEIEWGEQTDVGRQRTSNQDCSGMAVAPGDGARLWIVADGMGGHAGGEIASRIAVDTAIASFAEGDGDLAGRLRAAIVAANRAVLTAAQQDRALTGMGTTAVAIAVAGESVCVANVGDSRAYRIRRARIEQLTRDHSVVAELVRRGHLSEDEAMLHPRRHEVLRSLGFEWDLDVDVEPAEAAAGDTFLLCSDGLSGVVDDAEIASLCAKRRPSDAARALVDAANARGGPDNITVQVIHFGR
ncbi:MAG TPA: Stp1/IreP family PP2C-type Ser/Thr phosphatase [Myxococcota bacterium]|nr:Stp1/IreP family PP2C-type Ser/Thr phosphatase [Myxococcota bacterium]